MPCTCGWCVSADPQVLRIGGDRLEYLGGDFEQQPVDDGLVGVSDVGDGGRQREHHVVVVHRQQVALPGFEPALRRTGLALRAVPVAAGVVRDLDLVAPVATKDMTPERGAAALLDGGHDLELTQAQVAALGNAPRGPVGAEDVGDLEGEARHLQR